MPVLKPETKLTTVNSIANRDYRINKDYYITTKL